MLTTPCQSAKEFREVEMPLPAMHGAITGYNHTSIRLNKNKNKLTL